MPRVDYQYIFNTFFNCTRITQKDKDVYMEYFYSTRDTAFKQLECALKAAHDETQIASVFKGFIRYKCPDAVFDDYFDFMIADGLFIKKLVSERRQNAAAELVAQKEYIDNMKRERNLVEPTEEDLAAHEGKGRVVGVSVWTSSKGETVRTPFVVGDTPESSAYSSDGEDNA